MDASGVHLALTRRYGRAPKGERGIGTGPQHDGQQVTLLGALGVQGLQAVMTGDGATEAAVFRTSGKRGRGPTLAAGDIVGLDNLSAHPATGVQQALARRQVRRLFWPPYSPEMSPMERCLSTRNTAVRAAKARTRDPLEAALRKALQTVTTRDAWHWFKHGGYAIQ